MRILCLHGYGTSAAIFRQQLDPFIREIDPSYEFVFLEGEHECPPARGISPKAGPTLCFNLILSPEAVQASIDLVDDFIESDGPFDGILGFSQGGSVVLSYLVHQMGTMEDPPFKFAILLSTIAGFSSDPGYCNDLVTGLTAKDNEMMQDFPFGINDDDYAALSPPQPQRATFFGNLGQLIITSIESGYTDPHGDQGVDGIKAPVTEETASSLAKVPRMLDPSVVELEQRISIPTVHVTGRQDNPILVRLSQLMEKLCESGSMRSMTHEGGHSPPRSARDVKTLVKNVEWAMREGQMRADTM